MAVLPRTILFSIAGMGVCLAFSTPGAATTGTTQIFRPYVAVEPQRSNLRQTLAATVDYDIVTALDVSGSMRRDPELPRHLSAIARAVENPSFAWLLFSGERRAARLEFFVFSGRTSPLAGPVMVSPDNDGLAQLAGLIRSKTGPNLPQQVMDRRSTDMEGAMARGLVLLGEPGRAPATRRILNIVTDVDGSRLGSAAKMAALRARATEAGVEINVLHLGAPGRSILRYFHQYVATGFVLEASDFASMEAAYEAKFQADIAGGGPWPAPVLGLAMN